MNSDIIKELKEKSNNKYGDFSAKLLPGIPREKILGVKIPQLRLIAKNIVKNNKHTEFLDERHYFIEEILLHGFILGYANFTKEKLISEIEKYLPLIDNWVVCDCTANSLKSIKRDKEFYYKKCKEWLNSDKEFTVRFAVVLLLNYYLDEDFDEEIPDILAKYETEKYYINIAIAWYFSYALIKQYEKVIDKFIKKEIKNEWVHNKSIQKALESYRISEETKKYLRGLKIKDSGVKQRENDNKNIDKQE